MFAQAERAKTIGCSPGSHGRPPGPCTPLWEHLPCCKFSSCSAHRPRRAQLSGLSGIHCMRGSVPVFRLSLSLELPQNDRVQGAPCIKQYLSLGVVAHDFNPRSQRQIFPCEFQAGQSGRVRPCLKTKINQPNKQKTQKSLPFQGWELLQLWGGGGPLVHLTRPTKSPTVTGVQVRKAAPGGIFSFDRHSDNGGLPLWL